MLNLTAEQLEGFLTFGPFLIVILVMAAGFVSITTKD